MEGIIMNKIVKFEFLLFIPLETNHFEGTFKGFTGIFNPTSWCYKDMIGYQFIYDILICKQIQKRS